MNDIKYELIIYWSVQDESFIVEVPELAGCKADGGSAGDDGVAAGGISRGPDAAQRGAIIQEK